MSILDRLLAVIDFVSEWSGKAVGFLLLPILGVMVFEVVSRYVFNAPTLWSTEAVEFLAGTLYVIGGVYTLYLRGHISVETLYNMLSPRWQVTTRLILHAPLFFLYIGILLWSGTGFAWDSLVEGEHSGSGWNPPVYPVKLVIPLGVLLMLLQGLSQFIHDIRALLGQEEPVAPSVEEGEKEL